MKKLKIILILQILFVSSLFAQTANVTVNIIPSGSGLVTGAGVYPIGDFGSIRCFTKYRIQIS